MQYTGFVFSFSVFLFHNEINDHQFNLIKLVTGAGRYDGGFSQAPVPSAALGQGV